jgi:hypothetical protein
LECTRVKPKTKADSELNPTLQCPAPTCGNALLATGIHIFLFGQPNDFRILKCWT